MNPATQRSNAPLSRDRAAFFCWGFSCVRCPVIVECSRRSHTREDGAKQKAKIKQKREAASAPVLFYRNAQQPPQPPRFSKQSTSASKRDPIFLRCFGHPRWADLPPACLIFPHLRCRLDAVSLPFGAVTLTLLRHGDLREFNPLERPRGDSQRCRGAGPIRGVHRATAGACSLVVFLLA